MQSRPSESCLYVHAMTIPRPIGRGQIETRQRGVVGGRVVSGQRSLARKLRVGAWVLSWTDAREAIGLATLDWVA